MEAQSLKKYILAAVRRFKKSSDPDQTFKLFPAFIMHWGKKRNPVSFRGDLDPYLKFVSLAFPYVTELFVLYPEW